MAVAERTTARSDVGRFTTPARNEFGRALPRGRGCGLIGSEARAEAIRLRTDAVAREAEAFLEEAETSTTIAGSSRYPKNSTF